VGAGLDRPPHVDDAGLVDDEDQPRFRLGVGEPARFAAGGGVGPAVEADHDGRLDLFADRVAGRGQDRLDRVGFESLQGMDRDADGVPLRRRMSGRLGRHQPAGISSRPRSIRSMQKARRSAVTVSSG
jgi:hypothetical protein